MNPTDRDVRQALEQIGRAQPLRGLPLLELEQVSARLRREGVPANDESREWALIALLHAIVVERLFALREAPAPPLDATPDLAREREALAADFDSANIEREAWSALYYRFLAGLGWSAGEVAEIARPGYSDAGRHLRRRLQRGYRALAELLGDRERAAAAESAGDAEVAKPSTSGAEALSDLVGTSSTPSAPSVHDAIRSPAAAASAVADPLPDAGLRLLAAVRDDDPEAPPKLAESIPSEALEALATHSPAGLDAYRLVRVAQGLDPKRRLDTRFLPRELRFDPAEDEGWGAAPAEQRYPSLTALLEDRSEPVMVLLGPPGGGKSTLLRRRAFDLALAGLRGESDRIPVFFQLALCPPGEADPRAWMNRRWNDRYPALPALDDLIASGRVELLLDGLNELPYRELGEYHARSRAWKALAQEVARDAAGSRLLFSCRSLDYSAPLSSPALRVPQIHMVALDADEVRDLLDMYAPDPGIAASVAAMMASDDARAGIRQPYLLRRLVEQLGDTPPDAGQAALFTGLVRRVLRRELERDNPRLAPEHGLLTPRELRSLVGGSYSTDPGPCALPERGRLIPGLTALATALQSDAGGHGRARLSFEEACDRLCQALNLSELEAEALLDAGISLGFLDEDGPLGDLGFEHALLQEYFAARALAREEAPAFALVPWRAAEVEPSLRELLDSLAPSEPLPALPGGGEDETRMMSAEMAPSPEALLGALAEADLSLAGRGAALPALRGRLSAAFRAGLAARLAERARHPAADLRARIAAAEALAELRGSGTSGFEESGAHAPPDSVELPAGDYIIGVEPSDEDLESRASAPRHRVSLDAFRIARSTVTNADWARFMAAGGYEEPRYWEGDAARAWLAGAASASGEAWNLRTWRARFAADPGLLDAMHDEGRMPDAAHAEWRARMALDEAAFEALVAERVGAEDRRAPALWSDPGFNHPAQPVVGICFFEARAYARWLAEATGEPWRLPTEAEWEAAARGGAGRTFAWGESLDPMRCNMARSHLRRPAPPGVFVEGDSPEGLWDMTGNVWEWTSSAWGAEVEAPSFGYPYDPDDGREEIDVSADVLRVTRGGSWLNDADRLPAWVREPFHPGHRNYLYGFRLARDG